MSPVLPRYSAGPDIFGTTHLRLADPAQLADIIGTEGFTVILIQVSGKGLEQPSCEVVATGSVKDFGDGDVELYAQWSDNLSASQWAANAQNQKSRATSKQSQKSGQKLEVSTFAVSPHYQRSGLGSRVLNEIKWLVSNIRQQETTINDAPPIE
jgi:hypothetical protein